MLFPYTFRRGGRRSCSQEIPALPIDTCVANWANRVVQSGGAAPSSETQLALSTFYVGLLANPTLFAKLKAVNCFVPDNLTACLTPLISYWGSTIWANGGFVSGDVSTAGLAGNGSKYLNTGAIPGQMFGANSNNSAGITLYASVNPSISNSDIDAGLATGSGAQAFYLACVYASYSYWHNCNNVGGQGALGVAYPQATGYFSGNRTASNYSALYVASSTLTHNVASSISTNGGANPGGYPAYVFANNNNGGGPQAISHKTFSFAAFHDGLTVDESSNFYNLIQAMRRALGGGYV